MSGRVSSCGGSCAREDGRQSTRGGIEVGTSPAFTDRLAVPRALGVLVAGALLLTGCGQAGSSSGPSPAPSSVPKLSVPLPAEVQQKGKLVVGVKCDYPPFGYTNASGQT